MTHVSLCEITVSRSSHLRYRYRNSRITLAVASLCIIYRSRVLHHNHPFVGCVSLPSIVDRSRCSARPRVPMRVPLPTAHTSHAPIASRLPFLILLQDKYCISRHFLYTQITNNITIDITNRMKRSIALGAGPQAARQVECPDRPAQRLLHRASFTACLLLRLIHSASFTCCHACRQPRARRCYALGPWRASRRGGGPSHA